MVLIIPITEAAFFCGLLASFVLELMVMMGLNQAEMKMDLMHSTLNVTLLA